MLKKKISAAELESISKLKSNKFVLLKYKIGTVVRGLSTEEDLLEILE